MILKLTQGLKADLVFGGPHLQGPRMSTESPRVTMLIAVVGQEQLLQLLYG